jgi:hypothetical protein
VPGPGGADAVLTYRTQIEGEEGVSLGFRHLAESIDDTDRSARKSSDGITQLGMHLDRARGNVAMLRQEFADTGDMRLLKEIGKGERDVKNITGWLRHFGDESNHAAQRQGVLTRAVASTWEGMGELGAMIPGVSAEMGPYVLAVGGAVAAMALVPIVASVGGLAVAALGGGMLAAGIKIASGNAKVEGSLSRLSTSWDILSGHAAGMIARELSPAIDRFEGKLHALEPVLADLFIGPATAIGPLEAGLEGLIDNLLPGLMRTANASSESLTRIGQALPQLGAAVGDALDHIALGAQGGTDALLALINVVEIGIKYVGTLVLGAERLYQTFEKTPGGSVFTGIIQSLAHTDEQQKVTAVSTAMTRQEFEKEAAASEEASGAIHSLVAALGLVKGDAVAVAQAQLASANATAGVAKAMRDSHAAINGNSQASRDLRGQIIAAISTYGAQADAVFKATGNTRQSTDAFYGQVNALRATVPAGSAARGQLDALIASMTKNRNAANADATSIAGINQQIAQLKSKIVEAKAKGDGAEVARLQRQLDNLRDKVVTVRMITAGMGGIDQFGSGASRTAHRAAGGPVMAGRAYTVGEVGREAFVPNVNGQIMTARDLKSMNGGGSGGTVNNFYITTGADPDSVVAAIQRYAQRNNGVPLRGGVRTI